MNLTPEMIIEMQRMLKPSKEATKKLLDTTWEPFSEIPYDKFQKFTFSTKSDLVNYVLNYISNRNSKIVVGKDDIPIYGFVGYEFNDNTPSFFIMYYFKNAYSAYNKGWVDCLELYSLVIPETLRRQGIAKQILNELENLASNNNIHEVHIKAVISPGILSMIKNMGYYSNGNIMNYSKSLYPQHS